jgi:hypothetical protein
MRSGMPRFVTATVTSIISPVAVALQLTFGVTSISRPRPVRLCNDASRQRYK